MEPAMVPVLAQSRPAMMCGQDNLISQEPLHFSIPEGARTQSKRKACGTEPELSDQNPEHGSKHLESEAEI